MPDMGDMDKMMQELFSGSFGGPPGEGGGAPPDITNLAKLIGQFAGEDANEEVSDQKVEEAQKLF
jgi:hypothetical protein